jgi:hypothetical protein
MIIASVVCQELAAFQVRLTSAANGVDKWFARWRGELTGEDVAARHGIVERMLGTLSISLRSANPMRDLLGGEPVTSRSLSGRF